VTLDTIANLRTYITDQDGNLLNLRGEVVIIRLNIKRNEYKFIFISKMPRTKYINVELRVLEDQKAKIRNALHSGADSVTIMNGFAQA